MVRIKITVDGVPVFAETHDVPHPDELFAAGLIEKFGTKDFLRRYAKGGRIKLGAFGGPLDEHPRPGIKRKEGECATTLAAKALGVYDDPALKPMIDFICLRDLRGGGQPFEIHNVAKQMSKESPEEAMEWLMKAFNTIYQRRNHLEATSKSIYEKVAKNEQISRRGRQLLMAILLSDDEQVKDVAFSRDAAVVLQKKSSGNVQVYTNVKFQINLDDVARMINLAEQQAAGRVTTTDWEDLAAEGKIPGGRWHFFPKGQMLLNGSLSYPDVPPTRLPLDQIKKIVQIGIDPFYLPQHCRASRNCIFRRCGWYSWGLRRCQDRRD